MTDHRAHWILDPSVVFLNHGSFGACPRAVLDAQTRWRERIEAEPVKFFEREGTEHMATVRALVATYLNADPDGLAFVRNTTTGVNTVLASLDLGPGDEVLVLDHAYPAVANTAALVCERTGATPVTVHIPLPLPSPSDIVDLVAGHLTDRTRVAVLDHITSPSAVVLPIEELVAACRARGVQTLVDAAHAPGMVGVDVDALGADYWTGNFHKWLCAPKGAAALWVAPRHRDRVRPLVRSQPWLTGFIDAFDWTGTDDPTPFLVVPDAIAFMNDLGDIGARNHDLVVAGMHAVAHAIGVEPDVPEHAIAWMASVPLPGGAARTRDEARALNARMFDEHRIEVPFTVVGEQVRVRMSAHAYTTARDFETLADALPRLLA